MFRILLLLFILMPVAEFVLLHQLWMQTNLAVTLAVVVLTGVVGAHLARSQGYIAWRRVQDELSRGQMPSASLLDAMMIFAAGALLVTPGMLTDAIGLSLLIPAGRAFYRRAARRYLGRRFRVEGMHFTEEGHPPGKSRSTEVIDSYVVESESTPTADEAETRKLHSE